MVDSKVPVAEQREPEWLTFQAICYLRMGELDNCTNNHNADSCMFPIHGAGIHKLQRGSRGAIASNSRQRASLRARWRFPRKP